ncbi:plasmid mobilization protein [Nitrospirillum iridis]|uniref:Uncharacterized protein n=1 Tax=Nitrospirillum iridis TaxID=765888 RepID=A0A7X0ECC0_9PROT|nr:hypothetical protein [Nitrospirillum iridis]MBB6249856.1 hypothetical protein [Nitrospirillum iridis]
MLDAQELATERVTTLMTPSEKAKLEAKARKVGVSVGEFVRRSVDAFDPEEAMLLTQLAALAAELDHSNRDAAAALDRALMDIELTRHQLRAEAG